MNKLIGLVIFILTIVIAFAVYHFPCNPPEAYPSCAHGQFQNVEATFWISLISFFAMHVYMLPTIVANLRRHPLAFSIFWGNIAFGWTALGWFASMMAASSPIAVWERGEQS